MSHLISIELDSDIAKRIIDCLDGAGQLGSNEESHLYNAIDSALKEDDTEE